MRDGDKIIKSVFIPRCFLVLLYVALYLSSLIFVYFSIPFISSRRLSY